MLEKQFHQDINDKPKVVSISSALIICHVVDFLTSMVFENSATSYKASESRGVQTSETSVIKFRT